ncbi:flagellar biosynthesis protein FlhF [Vallitalea pronyensis]|uniref:Flagellar biosynthesis protein FlhF n=1 Tax=Vallitalea pronyensis TaxID=1348613 RepID=A0A8J8MKD5_9FIRM|nr:flagellar biosynthesis protein FlhF [Vallitalea pronyensis]QUI23244.1 flagellar biosynthesis protein FlhF [Vallitalea pronyensis]
MKIKQFEARTETEAMLQVKEEFGKNALIVSVKTVRPKGIVKLFKKPYVQITAALDEKAAKGNGKEKETFKSQLEALGDYHYQSKTSEMEEKITKIEQLLKKNDVRHTEVSAAEPQQVETSIHTQNFPLVNLIYEQLLENEVDEKVINKLMFGLNESLSKGTVQMKDLIAIIYQRIIDEIGDIEPINLEGNTPKIVVFMGPTGVGKTTTIAKLASHYSINQNMNVGLITADTYRIAAVEQLRTYGNILNIPVDVVYTNEEVQGSIDGFGDKDLIMIDTAGRSHKNNEWQADIKALLNGIPDKEVFLVLSATTKYKDLMHIANKYQEIADYKLIFSKLDESTCMGNILNVRHRIGATMSYITFGQNVPDDFTELNPHDIAKSILGGHSSDGPGY